LWDHLPKRKKVFHNSPGCDDSKSRVRLVFEKGIYAKKEDPEKWKKKKVRRIISRRFSKTCL